MPQKAPYHFIETDEDVSTVSATLRGKEIIAVDFEGEYNLHRFGMHLCLIQVFDGKDIWLMDPVKLKDPKPFLDVLEDASIIKVMHGPQSDLALLDMKYQCRTKNIFDTEKAAQFLNYKATSLSALIETEIGIPKDKKVREMDWNIRPLPAIMLDYAANDVRWLIQLYAKLKNELIEKNRLVWHDEECALLEALRHRPKTNPHLELKGVAALDENQQVFLKYIYKVREEIAIEWEKPAYYILSNQMVVQFATTPPETKEEFYNFKGANPRLKELSPRFFSALEKAKEELKTNPPPKREYNKEESKKFFKRLDLLNKILIPVQNEIVKKYDIHPLILSLRTIRRLAQGDLTWSGMRNWQREIISEEAVVLEISLKPVIELVID